MGRSTTQRRTVPTSRILSRRPPQPAYIPGMWVTASSGTDLQHSHRSDAPPGPGAPDTGQGPGGAPRNKTNSLKHNLQSSPQHTRQSTLPAPAPPPRKAAALAGPGDRRSGHRIQVRRSAARYRHSSA